jgi:DNA modification methylase
VKNVFTLSRSDYQHTYEPILYGWSGNVVNHHFIGNRDIPNVWEDIRELRSEFDGENTIIKFQGFEVKIKGKVEGEVRRRKQKTDIWRYDKPNRSKEHPTMKPIELCAEAIKNSSKQGEVVLDLFGGSGSTLIACEQLNRKARLMELDPKYVDVIIDRWEKLTGLKAEKLYGKN